MSPRVCAVIAAFNRRDMLRQGLSSLRDLTFPLAGIVVVDNGSSDGTGDMVRAEFPDCDLIQLQTNEGGAGGFHEGIRRALDGDFDWFWLMDDDVTADPKALETLMSFTDQSQCLNCLRRNPDGSDVIWEAYLDVRTGELVPLNNSSFKNGKEICFVNAACFEGMLIHRSIVEKIGLPDKRFFVGLDDTTYGLLASLHTNVAYVRDAIINRLMDKRTEITVLGRKRSRGSDFITYYLVRNRYLLAETLREYGFIDEPRAKASLFSHYSRTLLSSIAYEKSWSRVKTVVAARRDGRAGRFGRRG